MAVSAEALPRRGANRWPAIGRYALLVTAAAVVLFPVYCAFVIALQPTSRLLSFPGILLPTEPDLSTFSRSEEHTSELQSLMRISYAVFCLKKKKKTIHTT